MLDRVLDALMSHQQCKWFTMVAKATTKIVFSVFNFVETEKFQKGYFAKTSYGTKYSRMGLPQISFCPFLNTLLHIRTTVL